MRKYSRLNPRQISLLEAAFTNNNYLTKTTLMQVAHQTSLCEKRIRVWFQYRRSNIKNRRKQGLTSHCEYMHIKNIFTNLNICTYMYNCIYFNSNRYS